MRTDSSSSQEGGWKVVFDVVDDEVEGVTEVLSDSGFDVRPYYSARRVPPPLGGAAYGSTRMGAERVRRFVRNEGTAVLAAFEAICDEHALPVSVRGLDSWQAGGHE